MKNQGTHHSQLGSAIPRLLLCRTTIHLYRCRLGGEDRPQQLHTRSINSDHSH